MSINLPLVVQILQPCIISCKLRKVYELAAYITTMHAYFTFFSYTNIVSAMIFKVKHSFLHLLTYPVNYSLKEKEINNMQ